MPLSQFSSDRVKRTPLCSERLITSSMALRMRSPISGRSPICTSTEIVSGPYRLSVLELDIILADAHVHQILRDIVAVLTG